MSRLNIVFFASSSFVIPILEDILKNQNQDLGQLAKYQLDKLDSDVASRLQLPENWHNYVDIHKKIDLKLIVSQPDRQLRQKVVQNPVSDFAKKNSLDLFTPSSLNKEFSQSPLLIQGFDLGLVASFGQIVSQSVLDQATYGFINWHPSKLPAYRGATPMQTALADGQDSTALSWITMTKEMDAGDVWLQIDKEIRPDCIFEKLAIQMGILGSKTWALVIALKILSMHFPQIQAKNQQVDEATFCYKLSKEDALVDAKQMTARQLFNHWRAYHLFPGTKINDAYFNSQIKLAKLTGFYENAAFERLIKTANNILVHHSDSWQQIKINNQIYTFLQTKSGLVEVEQIILETGKNINFRGYQFI